MTNMTNTIFYNIMAFSNLNKHCVVSKLNAFRFSELASQFICIILTPIIGCFMCVCVVAQIFIGTALIQVCAIKTYFFLEHLLYTNAVLRYGLSEP